MKRILIFAFMTLSVVACNMDAHSEYSMTSISDFEFDVSSFDADSLYQAAAFRGGSDSYSLVFNNMHEDGEDAMTGGVAATMKRDSSLNIKSDNKYPQYTMFATSAARNSTACAVYYQNDEQGMMPDHDILFSASNASYSACTPSYFMINNTQQTVFDVLAKVSSSKFEAGDWLKLTITGSRVSAYTNALTETGSVEYYLVDWRGGNDEPDSLLTSWKTVSLSKLGNIDYIDFDIESNKENIVKSFCFDNLVASIYVEY